MFINDMNAVFRKYRKKVMVKYKSGKVTNQEEKDNNSSTQEDLYDLLIKKTERKKKIK